MFFIPEIKFFFGTYYPEYDLTVKTNIVHIALGEAYESSAPSFFPAEYKKSFLIESIQKDDEDFDNSEGIISINENNGAVKVAHNHSLEEGSYKIIVKATTDDANLTLETDLTLIMSVAEDDDHDH
ncbi:hypothetical protein C9994_16090 [Marivirga lumbricoides]|uniref:Cadherin domain-containing protein n=1 Tax=Marivirga lumbricoides TaxID=1046115 RepID=A0A2T4DBB7_9BACT|nr:hypothetical protein C9994_16090 [Marivirga lumbricoides]